MDKIIHKDITKLHDFVALHKDDKDSPIVWLADILEKLARAEYYRNNSRYISRKKKVTKKTKVTK